MINNGIKVTRSYIVKNLIGKKQFFQIFSIVYNGKNESEIFKK